MSSFPLYESMCQNLKNKDLTKKQKKDFLTKIQKIDDHGFELIYILIRMYENNNSKDIVGSYKLPYSGIYINVNDVSFDLESFPVLLKQMLYKFIDIHLKTIEDKT